MPKAMRFLLNNKAQSIFIAIFFVALFSALAFQGSRGLYDRDETRYSECAREILVTGSWLVPLRNFEPHLTKPPLTYWAIAASMAVIGINEWGARIPNAIAFSITVVVIGLIASRLFGGRYGPWASVIYLTSLVPFAASNIVTTDTLLVMWEVLSIWSFLAGYQAATRERVLWWFSLMGLFWGLGFLTKGPAVFPVGAATFIFWLLRRREFRAFPFGILPTLVFLSTWLWWYLAICLKYPWAFDLIMREQVVGRLFSSEFHRNSAWYAPFYLYLPILALGLFPWNIKLLQWVSRKRPSSLLDLLKASGPEHKFVLLWFFVPVLIFSLAKSRLPLYILPAFAPMAILAALALVDLKQRRGPLRDPVALCTLIVLISLKYGITFFHPPQDARAMYERFSTHLATISEIDALNGTYLDGLSFYSGKRVEYLPKPSLFCAAPNGASSPWDEEFFEFKKVPEVFVLDLKKKDRIAYFQSKGLVLEPLAKFYRLGLFRVGERAGENRPEKKGPNT